MAIINKSDLAGQAVAVLLNTDGEADLTTVAVESVTVDYGGFVGDAHHGLTRASCVRVRQQYAKGTEIRNTRQVSILAEDELQQIASAIGLESISPEWVGANLLLSGIPRLSQLPPSTRLIFSSGAALVIDVENAPCKFPGEIISRMHPEAGKRFAKAAVGLRGVTAWVEREGAVSVEDTVEVHLPPNRLYQP